MDAALERMLEYSDASELDTAESVAVAAMLDSSELSEEARLDRALDAPLVTVVGAPDVAVLAMLDASERAEDATEETTLDASDAADDTMLDRAEEL